MIKIKKGSKKKRSGLWDVRIAVYISREQQRKLKDVVRVLNMTETMYIRKILSEKLENIP